MSQQPKPRSRKNLYLTAFLANLSFTSCGCAMAWPSPATEKLKHGDEWLHITEDEEKWIVSLIAIGGLCGPLITSRLLDTIGRKWTLFYDVILLIIAWFVVSLPINIYTLYFGRFLTGIAIGIIFMALPVYIGEVSDVDTRGSLGSLNEFFIAFGFFVEYAIGSVTSYFVLILASTILPVIFLITFYQMPESPHYLMHKGRKDEAIEAIKWIRMFEYNNAAEKESEEIQALLDDTKNQESSIINLFKVKGNRRALLIVSGLILTQQMTGVNVIQFYTQSILKSAGDVLPKGLGPTLIGLTQFLSSMLTPLVTRKLGLKIPLLISAFGTFLTQGCLGLFIYYDSSGQIDSNILYKYIPLVLLIFFMFFFCLGLGPLPWAVVGEMFPANIKALSSSFASSFCFTLTFFITKFFAGISSRGSYTDYFIFSICCFIGFIFIALTIPDTRGMTLQDIQDVMNGRIRRSLSVQMVNQNRRTTETGSMIHMIMRSGLLVEQPEANLGRSFKHNGEYRTVMITEA